MTCFGASTWPVGLAALLGLAACQMDNPAFDDDGRVDEVGDANSEESGSSGESGESGSSSGADTTDTLDTLETADQSETESSDGNEEVCTADFTSAYAPIYGVPVLFDGQLCPPNVFVQHLKVTGAGPSPGLIMGQRCLGEGCASCAGDSLPIGVVGLDDFSTPLTLQDQNIECITVQTGNFNSLVEGLCVYDSLWVGLIDTDLLFASRRESVYPPEASAMIQGKDFPIPGETHVNCSCASVYDTAEEDEDLGCCEAQMGQPMVSSLLFLGEDVLPGSSTVVTLSDDYTFHVAQAQNLPSCANDGNVALDMSWALVRVPTP